MVMVTLIGRKEVSGSYWKGKNRFGSTLWLRLFGFIKEEETGEKDEGVGLLLHARGGVSHLTLRSGGSLKGGASARLALLSWRTTGTDISLET